MKKIVFTACQLSSLIDLQKREMKKAKEFVVPFILITLPYKQSDKNKYINSAFAYISGSATQTRLHIDGTKFTTLSDLIGGPASPTGTPPDTNSTPHTWNYVYPLATTKLTRNKSYIDEKDELIIKIKDAFNDIYSDIPDSVITKDDTIALGIKPKKDRKNPTPEPELIKEMVVIGLKSLGGGNVEVTCRISTDSKRASKLNEKVDIEFAYSVIEKGTTPPQVPPATSAECQVKVVVTTAKFILQLGEDAQSKKLYLFARWVYVKHPTKSGKFGVVSIGIS